VGLLTAIWFILPAYVANGGACAIHNTKPVDGGRYAWDGRRIIGDGVTYGGFAAGTAFAMAIAVVQFLIAPDHFPLADASLFDAALLGFLLGFGALFGDMTESFFKRRLGIARGRPLPLLDQWDFLIGALVFASFVYIPPVIDIVILFILTPLIHYGTNVMSNKVGIKDVPW
jgi:CDP-2,3-bis-(O-geranylgeranyl)-sn-glycerol synthase